MNILEAYLKKYKQFIILILGLPCSNKSEIAKELVIDLHLPIININDYLKPDTFIEKTVNNVIFKLYEHPDNYDWDKLNKDVSSKKETGVILYGNYIDNTKIDFKIDFSYFFNMGITLCKKLLIEKKLLEHKDDDKIDTYLNEIFKPIYEDLKQKITINRFFNIKETSVFDDTYNELFDFLMTQINKKL